MEPKLITEVLHVLKSRHYVATVRHSDEFKLLTFEPGDTLLQNQYIKICRVAEVRIRSLNISFSDVPNDPKAKTLAEKIGKPPATKLFQYTFVPVGVRLAQRLDAGAEFYVADKPTAKPITVHVAHLYYTAYVSRRGRVYSETPGGAKAYMLFKKGELKWPQDVYVHRSGHRIEIGVRIPIDEEQMRQLLSYFYSC
jgi:hypothetical protein